jgi:lipopolysaccharide export system protein LptA
LLGNVTVSQGQTVMKGERLVVNLTSGVSRVEGGKSQVRILIPQNSQAPASGGTQAPGIMPKLGPRPFPSN